MSNSKKSSSSLLVNTHEKGDRKREQYLREIAYKSATNNWSWDHCRVEIQRSVITAVYAKKLPAPKSAQTLISEAQLAGHPDVRHEFDRLMAQRDEVWHREPELARAVHHGPSQVLVDMMRRQRKPNERHFVASVESYLKYLVDRLRNKS